jgi:two-component system, NarL family, nitrate/nitrite response regulator NarL
MPDTTDRGSNLAQVIVADSRSFMRGCLTCWLNKFGRGFQSFVTADAVEAVAEKSASHPRAVILSASSRPEGRAWLVEQATGLLDAVPAVPMIVILDEAVEAGQETALTLGAQGFIPMSSSPEIAIAALRLVIAGGRYYPHDIAAGPRRAVTTVGPSLPHPAGKSQLTSREQAVFKLLSEGLPNKLIARILGLALSTVKIHVHHILEKLNVQNRTEVAIWGRVVVASPVTKRLVEKPVSQQILGHDVR